MKKTAVILSFLFFTACMHRGGSSSCAEIESNRSETVSETNVYESNSVTFDRCQTRHHELTDSLLLQEIINVETPSQILVRKGYVASYNKDTKCPNWVAWHLTADHAIGSVPRPKNAFHEDSDVPEPRAQWSDYKSSGYARGHMCPAGDNKWDAEAMWESFLMTNIVPQNRNLNDGDWNEIEMQCRKWARQFGDIYIVCGPLPYKQPWNTIGEKKIVVPRALFKVVLCLSGDRPEAIGFVYKNIAQNNPKSSYVYNLNQVERVTGIKFFPSLPQEIRDQIEGEANLSAWGIAPPKKLMK